MKLLVVVEGKATFDDGKSRREVSAGETVVVDADRPHFITVWLDSPPTP